MAICRRLAMSLLIAVVFGWPALARIQANLKIVVIEGEGAVNVIQQKTAVAPVVEVRDRNDQPVAGVVVTFSIRSGGASFGAAQTLTVTTNAAGRAVATGLLPAGAGVLSIAAVAAFQGETVTATIAQTNVMTAAQAAAAGTAGTAGTAGAAGATGAGATTAGGAAAAGGAAGAAGGGISATTIGLIGGAAAGAALAASRVAAGDSTGGDSTPQPKTEIKTYTGSYAGPFVVAFPGCSNIHSVNGTLTLRLTITDGVVVSGTTTMTESRIVTDTTCPDKSAVGTAAGFPPPSSSLTALPKMDFTTTTTNNWTGLNNAGNSTQTWTFEGSLNGSNTEVTGALTDRVLTNQTTPTPISSFGNGLAVFAVTLR